MRGFFLAATLREHRIEHLRDGALLGLGQRVDAFELLLNLRREKTREKPRVRVHFLFLRVIVKTRVRVHFSGCRVAN
jgi:hypothetical protein